MPQRVTQKDGGQNFSPSPLTGYHVEEGYWLQSSLTPESEKLSELRGFYKQI